MTLTRVESFCEKRESSRSESPSFSKRLEPSQVTKYRWEDDRCLHVALLYDIRYKCQLNMSLRAQPLLPALDVFSMG